MVTYPYSDPYSQVPINWALCPIWTNLILPKILSDPVHLSTFPPILQDWIAFLSHPFLSFFCPSMYLSIHPSIYLSSCLSIYPFLFVSLYTYPVYAFLAAAHRFPIHSGAVMLERAPWQKNKWDDSDPYRQSYYQIYLGMWDDHHPIWENDTIVFPFHGSVDWYWKSDQLPRRSLFWEHAKRYRSDFPVFREA